MKSSVLSQIQAKISEQVEKGNLVTHVVMSIDIFRLLVTQYNNLMAKSYPKNKMVNEVFGLKIIVHSESVGFMGVVVV